MLSLPLIRNICWTKTDNLPVIFGVDHVTSLLWHRYEDLQISDLSGRYYPHEIGCMHMDLLPDT